MGAQDVIGTIYQRAAAPNIELPRNSTSNGELFPATDSGDLDILECTAHISAIAARLGVATTQLAALVRSQQQQTAILTQGGGVILQYVGGEAR